jgi:hypothetical protein
MSAPVASFDLKDGSQLTLFQNRLVHEGGGTLETVPLRHLASVRVGFERDARLFHWAMVLLVVALVLFLVSGPLLGWSNAALAKVAENSRRESLEAMLHASFSVLAGFARLLPWAGAALALVAAACGTVFGIGATVLTLSFAASERRFIMRGRSRPLAEFAEVVGEQLAQHGGK